VKVTSHAIEQHGLPDLPTPWISVERESTEYTVYGGVGIVAVLAAMMME